MSDEKSSADSKKKKGKKSKLSPERMDEIRESFSDYMWRGKLQLEDLDDALKSIDLRLTERGKGKFTEDLNFKQFLELCSSKKLVEKVLSKHVLKQEKIRVAFDNAEKHKYIKEQMPREVLQRLIRKFTIYEDDVDDVLLTAPKGREGYLYYKEVMNMLLVEALREELQM
mmetsp:Transcript_20464/g.28746  ORF Transcript_20464/g.28746 Transcript_20464/m.28746 type:complete len:170 (+) Transcript_20464:97-606(+)